ncbi:nuclease [Pilobolus umbonatus]|nr:nuclease [Pilobolus umbonatus]
MSNRIHPACWFVSGFLLGMWFMYSLMPLPDLHSMVTVLKESNKNPILQFGNPGPVHDLLERESYTLSYNRKDRIPHWVGEHLTSESIKIGTGVSRNKSKFVDDPDLPLLFKVFTQDYTNSGYDRGHMAPAADAVLTQKSMDETFFLSNIAPQVGIGFNRHYWSYLEQFCRTLTYKFSDVYVYTGPLFLPQVVKDNAVMNEGGERVLRREKPKYRVEYDVIGAKYPIISVPTHFYKILLLPKGNDFISASFVLPNQFIPSNMSLRQFQVDIRAIETASGLEFFKSLDRSKFLDLCDIIACNF